MVHKYAWSNVGGYVNFGTVTGGVTITDYLLSGYAWSANDGWINLAPAQSGVKNNGNGTLSGFAWDEGAGWVNFTGVTIDSSGQFHGQATGGTVNGASYAITFDCTNCDVRTDWRPISARVSSGSSPGSISPIIITTVIPPPPTLPPSVSSTAPIASPRHPLTSGVSGKNPPSAAATALGSTTTTTFNTVSTSSAIHTATTTAKKTVVSSFIAFISSMWQGISISILILIAILVLFRFFFKF